MKPEEIAKILAKHNLPDTFSLRCAFSLGMKHAAEVEEVEFVDNDYDANVDCNRCSWSICYIHIEDNPMTFCPGCGNPIKR